MQSDSTLKLVISARDAASASVKNFQKNFQNATNNIQSDVVSVGRRTESLSTSFRSFADTASGEFDRVSSGIARFGAVAGAALLGGTIGIAGFVKEASQLQSIRASFESMTGSAQQAAEVLEQLNKFSFNTAFSSDAINSAARTLLGAGLAVKDLGEVLANIGDVAGATGADLGRLTLPLSQALARGKVQTEDFYQILDSGAGKLGQVLREEVAKRGMGELTKAMSDGLVTSELLFDVIRKSADEGGFAFQGAIKQSKTFDGQMSNLSETISNVALEVLGVNKATGDIDPNGTFSMMSNAVRDATKWLSDNKNAIRDVAKVILDNAIPVVTALGAAFLAAKVAAIGFSIAVSANPIGLIVAAITALVGGLVFLELKTKAVSNAFNSVRQVAQPLVDFFTANILPILTQVGNFIGNNFKAAWDDLSQSINILKKELEPFKPQLEILGRIIGIAVVAPLLIFIAVTGTLIAALGSAISIVARIIGWFSQFQVAVIRAAGSMLDSFSKAIGQVIGFFGQIQGKILGALGDTGRILYNAGASIIDGFRRGIVDAFEGVKKFVGGIAEWISKNKGPLSYDRVLLKPHGTAILKGLEDGIKKEWPSLQSLVTGIAPKLADSFTRSSLDVPVNASSPGISPISDPRGELIPATSLSPQSSNNTYNYNVSVTVQNDGTSFTEAQAVDMARKISDALRTQGLPSVTLSTMRALR